MGRKKSGQMWDQCYLAVRCFYKTIFVSRKDARKRLKILNGGYKGSRAEYQKVVEYWKPYHVKPKRYWYQIYGDGKREFDPRYIPDTVMDMYIYPYFCDMKYGPAYADKGGYDALLPDVRKPKTIVKNRVGNYYNGNQEIITMDEAIDLCLEEKRFIVKFSTATSKGKNIHVFESGEANKEILTKLFKEMKFNFVVQGLVEQHEVLDKIHHESLNTIRVVSFLFKGQVHILSAQLRMGSGDSRVDNYSAGGYACNINPDGRLSERAVSKNSGWAFEHPCGKKFKDIVVPNYDRLIEVVKREAVKLPQIGIIGWDFAIDKDGEPVFIELNFLPESNQNGSGPTFGNMTEEVLKEVFIDKSLKNAFI